MLTRDLLRYRVNRGTIAPQLLSSSGSQLGLAQALLAQWQSLVGQPRATVDEQLLPVLHASRSVIVANGLSKLIDDTCTWQDAADCAALRARAFAASAQALRTPARTANEHAQAIAATLTMDASTLQRELYGDLPDAQILSGGPEWSPEALINAYNLAQVQGLLLHAQELHVVIPSGDAGLIRRIAKAIRFRRLVATARLSEGELLLAVSGPGAMLDEARRYGLQLALFAADIIACPRWTLRAVIRPPKRDDGTQPVQLMLDHTSGLRADRRWIGHVPEELTTWLAKIGDALPGWSIIESTPRTLPDGDLLMPDLSLSDGTQQIDIELCHRWHADALVRRLEQSARGWLPRVRIGVDRALAKSTRGAPLVADARFTPIGFLFSELPAAKTLLEALQRRQA